jgi:parallel beta-helix repeat protein
MILGVCCVLLALPAQAQVVCGQNVTSNAKLTENLVCPSEGNTQVLTVTGARLDMNGFNIHCQDDSDHGIVLMGSRAHLLNGSVSGCNDGVRLEGNGRHNVSDVIAHANSDDGFHSVSANNTLSNVSAVRNGNNGFLFLTDENHLVNSYAVGNAESGVLVLEPNTTLVGNRMLGNGKWGILVIDDDCEVRGNLIVGNAEDGIRVLDDGNKISGNAVRANGKGGISLGPHENNSIHGNSVTGNNITDGGFFDMEDENVDCGTNKWTGNTFGTSNDPCIN